MQTPQPFQPGDRVVRVGSSEPEFGMYSGKVYTVDEIEYCCGTRSWSMSVLEAPIDMSRYRCGTCKRIDPKPWDASKFRKVEDISDHTVDSLMEELSQPVELILV